MYKGDQHHLPRLQNGQNGASCARARRPVTAVPVLPSQKQQPLLGREVPQAALSEGLLPSVGALAACGSTVAVGQSQGTATDPTAQHQASRLMGFGLVSGSF